MPVGLGRQPRNRISKRRVASFQELAGWIARDRMWIYRKRKEYELLGNSLNMYDVFDVLDFAVFLMDETNKE